MFTGSIRAAEASDLPSILALHNDAIVNSLAIWMDGPVDLANRRTWFNDRRAGGFPVLAAEIEGEFAGFASYGPFRSGDGYCGTVENSVYIAPAMRGRGVGRALMLALIEAARGQGRQTMIAAIGLPNKASVALHRSLGFEEAGILRRIGLKNGQRLDLMMLQLQL